MSKIEQRYAIAIELKTKKKHTNTHKYTHIYTHIYTHKYQQKWISPFDSVIVVMF